VLQLKGLRGRFLKVLQINDLEECAEGPKLGSSKSCLIVAQALIEVKGNLQG
jgi:hypothetical protein